MVLYICYGYMYYFVYSPTFIIIWYLIGLYSCGSYLYWIILCFLRIMNMYTYSDVGYLCVWLFCADFCLFCMGILILSRASMTTHHARFLHSAGMFNGLYLSVDRGVLSLLRSFVCVIIYSNLYENYEDTFIHNVYDPDHIQYE